MAEQDGFHRHGWGRRAPGAPTPLLLTLSPNFIQTRKIRRVPVQSYRTSREPRVPAPRGGLRPPRFRPPAPRSAWQRLWRIFTPITRKSLPTSSALLSEHFPRLRKLPRLKPSPPENNYFKVEIETERSSRLTRLDRLAQIRAGKGRLLPLRRHFN